MVRKVVEKCDRAVRVDPLKPPFGRLKFSQCRTGVLRFGTDHVSRGNSADRVLQVVLAHQRPLDCRNVMILAVHIKTPAVRLQGGGAPDGGDVGATVRDHL